jgi:hypothetical protein
LQWNSNAVAQGTYQVRAVAFDAAANTATSAPITVTVDRTAPATAVIVPSNDNTTVSGNAILDASATDNTAVTKAEFRATGGVFSNTFLGQAGLTPYGWIFIWDTNPVANGTYTIKSTAYDAAGNTANSGPRKIKVQH